MEDDPEDIVIPFINIKSIVEEREIYHEEELQKIVVKIVEKMNFQPKIELALDKGKEEVIIDFPDYVQKPLLSTYIGKIRFIDVFRNFSSLMMKEAYSFEFEKSYTGGCCFYPDIWGPENEEWTYVQATRYEVGCCNHCEKPVHLVLRSKDWVSYDVHNHDWKLIKPNHELTDNDCCKFMRNRNNEPDAGEWEEVSEDSEGILSDRPPCYNCLKPGGFRAIPDDEKTRENEVITKLRIKLC
jgi:hypothetical protein